MAGTYATTAGGVSHEYPKRPQRGCILSAWGSREGHGGVAMYAVLSTAESALVGDTERGDEIKRRLEALGISDREFHETTGIDRKTLRRAIEGQDRVRPSTFVAIESALMQLEQRVTGPKARAVGDPRDDLVEFTIEGNFGVRAVVKGPVRDMDALESAVAKLVRDMQQGPEE